MTSSPLEGLGDDDLVAYFEDLLDREQAARCGLQGDGWSRTAFIEWADRLRATWVGTPEGLRAYLAQHEFSE